MIRGEHRGNTYVKSVGWLFYAAVAGFSIFLTSHQFSGIEYYSDFVVHLDVSEKYFHGELSFLPHPLWHITVQFFKIFTIEPKFAGSLATAFFVLLWAHFGIIYVNHNEYLSENETRFDSQLSNPKSYLVVLMAIIVAPIYIPAFNQYILLGQGSPNMWHNPTLLAVKPFALACIYTFVQYLRNNNRQTLILCTILLVLSMFAKPSFAIAFLPSIWAFIILNKRFHSRFGRAAVATCTIAFLSISIYQYIFFFHKGDSSVVFDFLGVWSQITPNVFVSIVLALGFPLSLFFMEPKKVITDDYLQLAWIMALVSITLFASFAESGMHYKDGNFAWSYGIALSVLYLFSIHYYVAKFSSFSTVKKYLLLLILMYQLAIGLFYSWKLLNGMSYL